MYYMYPPNQSYFNGEIPTYGGNPQRDLLVNNYNQQQQNVPFGGYGYNSNLNNMGGYYNGGYYNPYLVREQQKMYEQQQTNKFNNDLSIMKYMLRLAYNGAGINLSDEELDKEARLRYCPESINQENTNFTSEMLEYQNLEQQNINAASAVVISRNYSPELQHYNSVLYNIQKTYEADNLYDWMTKFDEQQRIEKRRELEMQSRDLSGMYNSQQYNSLLQSHQSAAALRSSVDIDDLSVELPARLKDGYAERRQQFLNAILANMD